MDIDQMHAARIVEIDAQQERAMTDVMLISIKEFMTLRGVELRRLVRANARLDRENMKLQVIEAKVDDIYRLLCDMRAAYIANDDQSKLVQLSVLQTRIQKSIEVLSEHYED